MRFFYDTEFIEDGETIELISIGIVGDDGREYYAVSTDFDPARAGEWVRNNVLNQLPNPNSSEWKSLDTIRADLEELLHVPGGAELWAWVGCYDHVVLAQLKQYWEFAGKPQLPDLESGKHNALEDARHNVRKFQACMAALPIGAKGHVLPPN